MRFLAILLCLSLPFAANAKDPKLISSHGKWEAYSYKENDKPVCYIISKPIKEEGNYTKRGQVFAFITHRPAQKTFDEVLLMSGYTFKKGFAPKVDVDGKMWTFKSSGELGFPQSTSDDKALVKAMKAGSKMIVHGVSSRGTKTKDTWSLAGFTAAYRAIAKACK